MPRSKNPQAYEDFFWNLLEAMKKQAPVLEFELLTHKQAYKFQHRAYGFIYALEAHATKLRKQGEFAAAAQFLEDVNTMRGYAIHIDGSKLEFINRDMTEENLTLNAQLAKQVQDLPDILPTDPPPARVPNIFTMPLRITEQEVPRGDLDDLLDSESLGKDINEHGASDESTS